MEYREGLDADAGSRSSVEEGAQLTSPIPFADLGMLSMTDCERIEDLIFSLPAVIPMPDLQLPERFAYCSTPLIEKGHFSFRLLAEMSRTRQIELIPETFAKGDANMLDAIRLTNAGLDSVATDYRSKACSVFHEHLKKALGSNARESLLAYLPCLSIISFFQINLTSGKDGMFILRELQDREGLDDRERLTAWNAFDEMVGRVAVLLHFCKHRFLPGDGMSLRESMRVKAWWQDVQRVAKRLRETPTPEFGGVAADNGGVRRLHDNVLPKVMLALEKTLDKKRRSEPFDLIKPDGFDEAEDPGPDDVEVFAGAEPEAVPERKIMTRVERALQRRSPNYEVRDVVDAEALREDKGLRKITSESWSPAALARLMEGVIARRLQSEAFERLALEFPHAAVPMQAIARNLKLAETYGRHAYTIPRPLLLIGKPGVGKSHLARAIATACNLPSMVIPLGGADSKSVSGSHRSWSQSMPSAPVQAMGATGTYNSFLIFDEVDKTVTDSRNGNAIPAMLPLLERSSAVSFRDQFLCADVDCSGINYILTSNSADLPAPLLSRCEVIHLRAPERQDWPAIIAGVRRSMADELLIDERFLPELTCEDVEFLSSCAEIQNIRTLVAVVRRMLEHKSFEPQRQGAFH